MYFHEIAEELKIYMAPSERGGIFVVQLIGDTLRAPMTEEEEKMALDDKFNPLANGMSLNMQDQIFEGKKFISRNRAGLICSRYDGADFAEEIDNLYDADKDHLQMFLAKKGISVAIEELGSAMQDIMSQIFHGLSKGIHDVDICLTIHETKPSIKILQRIAFTLMMENWLLMGIQLSYLLNWTNLKYTSLNLVIYLHYVMLTLKRYPEMKLLLMIFLIFR